MSAVVGVVSVEARESSGVVFTIWGDVDEGFELLKVRNNDRVTAKQKRGKSTYVRQDPGLSARLTIEGLVVAELFVVAAIFMCC